MIELTTTSTAVAASNAPGPGPAAPTVSAIVPMLNAARYLTPCLSAVLAAAARHGRTEVIVVDNGSTDGTLEQLRGTYRPYIRLLEVPGRTISAVRNAGAASAGGAIFAFLDADCLVEEDYFVTLEAVFASVATDAAGSMYALPDAPVWSEAVWHGQHARQHDGYVHFLNAGNFAIRREAFRAVGGFGEALVTGEDADLGQRLQQAGLRIYEAQRLRAVHLGNPKTLGNFYRKQVWHGLGMFATTNGLLLDKPTAMMFAHLACWLGALGALLAPGVPPGWRFAFPVLLPWVVPAVTVLYRAHQRGRFFRPLAAMLLYQIYYLARLTSLAHVVRSRVARHTPEHARSRRA